MRPHPRRKLPSCVSSEQKGSRGRGGGGLVGVRGKGGWSGGVVRGGGQGGWSRGVVRGSGQGKWSRGGGVGGEREGIGAGVR